MAGRILVAIDGSEPSLRALEVAVERLRPASLVLLHVIDLRDATQGVEGVVADGWYAAREAAATELFDRATSRVESADIDVTTVIEVGRAAPTIVEVATNEGVDHIVLGSHGRSGLARLVLGSVAESVLRRSAVPVTVVREPA